MTNDTTRPVGRDIDAHILSRTSRGASRKGRLSPASPAFGLSADELTERHRDIPLPDQVLRQQELDIADGIYNLVVPPPGMDALAVTMRNLVVV